jgi:hypothetical protein
MERGLRARFRVSLIVGLFIVCSQASAVTEESSPAPASTPSTMDAKEARAWNIQQEHKKTIIYGVVSDFEDSLNKLDIAKCERQVHQSAAVLSLNGIRVTSCQEIIDQRRSTDQAHQKLKLSHRLVQIADTGSEAGVNVDVMPAGEHHSFTLQQIGKHWIIMKFASTVLLTQNQPTRF